MLKAPRREGKEFMRFVNWIFCVFHVAFFVLFVLNANNAPFDSRTSLLKTTPLTFGCKLVSLESSVVVNYAVDKIR